MTMSRKDYQAVAEILRRSWGVEYPTSRLVGEFVALFKRDNPRFDIGRFAIACTSDVAADRAVSGEEEEEE